MVYSAFRDENDVPVAIGVSSASATTVLPFKISSSTGRLLTDAASGSGTVTDVSVVSANGFAGTVATSTTTPAITLTTTVTGIIKGNGTAFSAATAGTDYLTPSTVTLQEIFDNSPAWSGSNLIVPFARAASSNYFGFQYKTGATNNFFTGILNTTDDYSIYNYTTSANGLVVKGASSIVQMPAYGVGVAKFDASGNISSVLEPSGSYSNSVTAIATFTVTIGSTMPNTSYKVNVTPTAALSAALFYVTNKTTTTFDVVYLAGLTGTVTFDWSIKQ